MIIVHSVSDSLFGDLDPDSLLAAIKKFYAANGHVPTVTIEGDKIIVEIDAAPLPQAEASFRKAVSCCNRGDFAKAENLLKSTIKTFPAYSDAYRLLAQIAMERGNIDRAIDVNISALKNDPRNLAALALMGNLLARDPNKLDQAMRYYEKVLELDPDNAIANANVGAILCKQGKVHEGIERFDKVLAAHPENLVAHHGKTMAYVALGDLHAAFEAASLGLKEGIDTPENPGVRKILTQMFAEVAAATAQRMPDPEAPARDLRAKIHALDPRPVKIVGGDCQGVLARLQHADMYRRDEHVVLYDAKMSPPPCRSPRIDAFAHDGQGRPRRKVAVVLP